MEVKGKKSNAELDVVIVEISTMSSIIDNGEFPFCLITIVIESLSLIVRRLAKVELSNLSMTLSNSPLGDELSNLEEGTVRINELDDTDRPNDRNMFKICMECEEIEADDVADRRRAVVDRPFNTTVFCCN